MQHTISYDPKVDELKDILTSICGAYGTSLEDLALILEPQESEESEVTDQPYDGPWNHRRAMKYLEQVADGAYKALALLTAKGSASREQIRLYLGVDNLRGQLSGVSQTANKIHGLRGARPWVRRWSGTTQVYTMIEPVQEIFELAFQEFDPGTLQQAQNFNMPQNL